MEKSTFNKKLKSYSALAGTLIAAGATADAQVIYTDVIPDATVATGATYNLDLDNNAATDFTISLAHQTYVSGTFSLQYDLCVVQPNLTTSAIDTVAGGMSTAHATGVAVNSGLLWEDGVGATYQLLGLAFAPPYTPYNTGNFLGQTDKYLGLRFQIAGADHYGYARITLNAACTSLIVKDYAYNATVNGPITTGATGVGISESAALANLVHVFSADRNIHVNMNSAAVNGTIIVTDVLGKVVVKTDIASTDNVISMQDANTGIYFVSVMQGNASFSQKVIIK